MSHSVSCVELLHFCRVASESFSAIALTCNKSQNWLRCNCKAVLCPQKSSTWWPSQGRDSAALVVVCNCNSCGKLFNSPSTSSGFNEKLLFLTRLLHRLRMAWNTSGGYVEASNVYYSHRSRSLSFFSSANIHTSRIKKNDYTPAHITLRRNGRRRINFHESWSLGWLLLLVASTENRNILILPHLNGTEQTRRRIKREQEKMLNAAATHSDAGKLRCFALLAVSIISFTFAPFRNQERASVCKEKEHRTDEAFREW